MRTATFSMRFISLFAIPFGLIFFHLPTSMAQEKKSIESQGIERSFYIEVPPKKFSDAGYPVVVAMHGFTQSARRIKNYSGFSEIAVEEGFIAVFPQGVQASWNFGTSLNDVDDVIFLSTLLDSLESWYPIDPARIYFCGFSNGGFMSYEMACQMSHRVTAIASVGGGMGKRQALDCEPEYPVSIMQIHGTADNVIYFEGQSWVKPIEETIEFWSFSNGCGQYRNEKNTIENGEGLISILQESYYPCEDQTSVELWKVYEGGHTWPGARARSGSGRTNRDMDASAEIWNFFSRHQITNRVKGQQN